MTALVQYESACAALAAAVKADEVMAVHLSARAIAAVARVAKNFDMEVDAVKLRVRAEGKLGEMLIDAERTGLLHPGGPSSAEKNGSAEEPFSRVKLKEIGVDKKLSVRAQKLGGIGQRAVQAMLDRFTQASHDRGRLAMDVILGETAKRNAGSRRQLATELSDTSAHMPMGRKFPVIYADPAWSRKAGIGNRAYENSFPTMGWDGICELPVERLALPDAWLFFWIPRAHLLAQTSISYSGESIAVPLAWRVANEWGFPKYSTCFVWTKTDELVPDDHGLGLIAWDQDELLLLFKRGNGLPKPDTDIKFGSNHRERPREHSRKPDFYRHMIRAMAGEGVPVLELFARKDPENPWPADWHTWGNQAGECLLLPHDPITGEIIDLPATGAPGRIEPASVSTPTDAGSASHRRKTA